MDDDTLQWIGRVLAGAAATVAAAWSAFKVRRQRMSTHLPSTPSTPYARPIAPGAVVQPAARPARIVIVEDQTSFRDMLARHLRVAGYEVIAQADHCDAALALDISLADVALVDLVMNGRGQYRGFDVIVDFRRRRPDLCIIAMSADDDRQLTAGRAGATGFWEKQHSSIADLVKQINSLFDPSQPQGTVC